MSSEPREDGDLLREAPAPGNDCLSIEDLGHYLGERGDPAWRAGAESHISNCSHCRTELQLLQEFQAGEIEARAVQRITAQQGRELAAAKPSWWQGLFTASWLSHAAVALAGILLIGGVGMEIRKSSAALIVVAPVGDLREAPKDVQWQPVAGAAKYRVQLLEEDRSPLWQAETTGTRVALPAAVRDRIVPGKTMLSEVLALDAAGTKIAGSEIVRFRVAPNIH